MNDRESRRRRRIQPGERRRWLTLALVVSIVLAWIWLGPRIRELIGAAGPGPGDRADSLRVVSWNLANFEGRRSGHDLDRIRELIAELDPDVIALQEINDPDELAALLPDEFELAVSERGGRGGQRVAIAWRRDRVELLSHAEQSQLSLDGLVRPGLLGYLRGLEGGPDFWLLVVHLKAMPDGLELRRQQWPMLVELAERESADSDLDMLIVGDFNTTGPPGSGPGSGPAHEQRELATILAPAALRKLGNATGCTAYYDGQRRDAWKQASEIDLIWARALDESIGPDTVVTSGTHCAASRCQDFRSSEAYPVRDYEFVSDHCPVVLDLIRADDD